MTTPDFKRWEAKDKFAPYLLQVLEGHGYPRPQRNTPAEARAAVVDTAAEKLESGLPRKVAQFVDDLTAWHYMGNAEYEFGSIPKAMFAMMDEVLVTKKFVIPKEKLPKNFSRGNMYYHEPAKKLADMKKRPKEKQDKKLMKELKALIDSGPENDLTLYYLGPKKYVDLIPEMLDLLCAEKLRTKAGTRFSDLADPITDTDRRYHGWLCLDYPFWMSKDTQFIEQLNFVYTGSLEVFKE